MKHQDENFTKALDKLKPLLKLHRLPVPEYTRKKLARYLEADKLSLTDSEVTKLDSALDTHQADIQDFRDQLKK